MSEQTDDRRGAVAGPVERTVRPCGWAHRYTDGGPLHCLRRSRELADDDVAMVGGTARVVDLFDRAALDAAVAAERERCARIVDIPAGTEAWEVIGGEEGLAMLRELAAQIRRA